MRSPALFLAMACFVLVVCGASHCATVTLDAATKSASSDSALLEAGKVKSKGDQIGVYVQSKSLDPQSLTMRIVGLKGARYDVYVNWGEFRIKRTEEMAKLNDHPIDTTIIEPGYLIRDKAASDLAAGIGLQLPGRVVPVPLMRCIQAVEPAVKGAYAGLGGRDSGELGRARWTLGQADEWVRSSISTDESYRSLQLFVVPAGTTPKEMDWRARLTAKGAVDGFVRACSLLQDARVKMYENLTDLLLREATLEALTPVQVQFRYYVQKQGPYVKVEIRNDCNLSVSGFVDVRLPKGWKTQPKAASFARLPSGKTYSGTLQLVPASKKQVAPRVLPATATIKIGSGKKVAKLGIIRQLSLPTAQTTPAPRRVSSQAD